MKGMKIHAMAMLHSQQCNADKAQQVALQCTGACKVVAGTAVQGSCCKQQHSSYCKQQWRTDNLQALAAQRVVDVDNRIRPRLCQEVHKLHAGKRGLCVCGGVTQLLLC